MLITQNGQDNEILNSKSTESEKYEIYEMGDTIDGRLLLKFKDELACGKANDKPINQAIWQMETFFNIKYGIKDGINGNFGGEIANSKIIDFMVPSYHKESEIFLSGDELIAEFIDLRNSIIQWISADGYGLVSIDFRVLNIENDNTKLRVHAISGASLSYPISQKRILRPFQSRPYPSDFETKYFRPFTVPNDYEHIKVGGDWGSIVELNPNQYPLYLTSDYVTVWTNVTLGAYAWHHNDEYHQDPNHQNLSFSAPWSLMGASKDYRNFWNEPLPAHTNPEQLFNLYKDYFINTNTNFNVLMFWIWSSFEYPVLNLRYNHYVYIQTGTPKLIHNDWYSQL